MSQKLRSLAGLLVLAFLVSMMPCAAAGSTLAPDFESAAGEDGILKVLSIGNSYSQDALNYLPKILKAEGYSKVKVAFLYKGSCTLEMHADYAQSGEGAYTYYKYDPLMGWKTKDKATLLDGLTDESWDVITLQTTSTKSGQPDTFTQPLSVLIPFINEHKKNPDAKLGWHMGWSYATDHDASYFAYYGYDQEYLYECITKATQSAIVPHEAFDLVVPSGTAIQNARYSYIGDNLHRDGNHLNELGRLITAYTWYAALTGATLDTLNFTEVAFLERYPTAADIAMITESVNNAIKTPYAVTPTAYKTEPIMYTATINETAIPKAQGSKVIIAAPEREGQEFERWEIVKGAVTLDNAASQSTAFIMPAGDVEVRAIYKTASCPCAAMTDVDKGAWYHEAVDYALSNGIMGGYNATTFGPNDTLSRAMVVQVLYNKEGQPAVSGMHTFADVPTDQWFNNAVTWGTQNGVMGGYNATSFGPNDKVTLEQIAVILWNYAGNPAFTGNADSVGTHSGWAANGLAWALENGILDNVPFENVTVGATRAQTAQMLMNYLEK